MSTRTAEDLILDRFRQKCQAAGGPRTGFVLRRAAILYVQDRHPEASLTDGIDSLVENGVLKASESGDFLFLSAAGVELLGGSAGAGEEEHAPNIESS